MTSVRDTMSVEDFLTLVDDEIGLRLTVRDLTAGFDELPGWDSVLSLQLLAALERTTGRRISMPDALEAKTLHDLYDLVVGE